MLVRIREMRAPLGGRGCAAGAVVLAVGLTLAAPQRVAAAPEYNAVRGEPPALGPEAGRLIVGFRANPANIAMHSIATRDPTRRMTITQARTTPDDVARLAQRSHLPLSRSRQLTPSMHVVYLTQPLYGSAVTAVLKALRADPAVKFADIDQRRYPHAAPAEPRDIPDDPLFMASPNATGQWYMMTPDASTATSDAAATDAVSAWTLTQGSTGTVIADVDTGVRFEHPDLLRAGFGGRLLPGYDFISEDQNPTTGALLGTYLIANDGDGWDPDPSDSGDWINSADQTNATLFPAKTCTIADSSWHGTRVMGILGALTNNAIGIAGMTWNPYLLPVRALGKCGGYDSDIITAMQWAAGMPVTGVPDNPFPAQIINLSLGGSGECPSAYADVVATLTGMGVVLVASAGNQSGPVDAPANCSGVLAVAGLRNVGTKVGYSSFGAPIGIAAPAGNCVNDSGPCLKSIDTTSNTGTTIPEDSSYTNQINPNLGTSFSAPIVTGIAALMLAVNANLTPAQVMARLKSSATPFPQPVGVPVCPAVATGSGECACPNDNSQCGAGMVNAANAVAAALRPIAAVAVTTPSAGSSTLDAGGSTAACGRTVAAYDWVAGTGISIGGAVSSRSVMVSPSGTAGILTLTVTDSAGATDTAILAVAADGTVTRAATTPSMAGSSAAGCPASLTVTPSVPTVTAAFVPASVGENVASSLTLTLANANGFDLTQSNLSVTLPAQLTLPAAATTTCSGGSAALSQTTATVALANANIPAHGSCTITVPLAGATAGNYSAGVAAHALTTGPGGSNTAAATATLTVTAPSGGGALDWWDTLFVIGVILAGRRGMRRK